MGYSKKQEVKDRTCPECKCIITQKHILQCSIYNDCFKSLESDKAKISQDPKPPRNPTVEAKQQNAIYDGETVVNPKNLRKNNVFGL